MSEEKENGVSSTRDVKNTVGDKDISISNSSAGNNNGNGNGNADNKVDNPFNLTGKALENWRLNQEFLAKKTRYISSSNFGDQPRTFIFDPTKLESGNAEGKDGKPYTTMVYTVIEPAVDSHEERFLNASSGRLVSKIAKYIFQKKKYKLEIQKTGSGFQTDWDVDSVD